MKAIYTSKLRMSVGGKVETKEQQEALQAVKSRFAELVAGLTEWQLQFAPKHFTGVSLKQENNDLVAHFSFTSRKAAIRFQRISEIANDNARQAKGIAA